MTISKKEIEEFEKENKNKIFNKIYEVNRVQFETIEKMLENIDALGKLYTNIPNTSVTLNNKLVELSQIFNKSGISLFSSTSEGYDIVYSSFIGDAIISDLMYKYEESIKNLEIYAKKIEEIAKQRDERVLSVQKAKGMKKIFLKIKSLFVSSQTINSSLTEEEQNILDSFLQKYKDSDSKIWNYNLENNLVTALVKEITGSQKNSETKVQHKYSASSVPGLLKECIIPDLKRLGLEHLISKLQKALADEYGEELTTNHTMKSEDMHLYVSNSNKQKTNPFSFNVFSHS